MKAITVQQLEGAISHIIADKENVSALRHEAFNGVSKMDVLAELATRLGDDWVLQKDPPVKFTREDINAVAASRFFRTTGFTMLMGWALLIALMAMFTTTYPIIPPLLYYILNAAISTVFLWVYAVKQKKVRKALSESLGIGKAG